MYRSIVELKSRSVASALAICCAIAGGSVARAADPAKTDAEVEQLAQARQMVRGVLNHWDFKTWNQLLADDVVFNVRLGTATKDSAGDPALVGMNAEYQGREAAKKALRDIYGDLHKDFRITTEITRGSEVVLMGELVVESKAKDPATLPIAVYMAFNPAGKIKLIGIFSVDVRALVAALQPATSG
ncbi:MAG TPA: hypothetical protein VGY55_00430 [Pirellulales bacterium]|jgi:hypothetical protein|nr:hypothetical protein [Pirellulales bacterium]